MYTDISFLLEKQSILYIDISGKAFNPSPG